MLIDPGGKRVDYDPYPEAYQIQRACLADGVYEAIVTEVQDYAEVNSSLSAAKFERRPSRELIREAFGGDERAAAMCHGHFVWEVLRHHSEDWCIWPPARDGDELRGTVYFRHE